MDPFIFNDSDKEEKLVENIILIYYGTQNIKIKHITIEGYFLNVDYYSQKYCFPT